MNGRVTCTGQIVDRGRRPVPHALIMILNGPRPVPEIALMADDAGRVTFALDPGEWTVQARAETRVGQTQVAVAPPETSFVIVIP